MRIQLRSDVECPHSTKGTDDDATPDATADASSCATADVDADCAAQSTHSQSTTPSPMVRLSSPAEMLRKVVLRDGRVRSEAALGLLSLYHEVHQVVLLRLNLA